MPKAMVKKTVEDIETVETSEVVEATKVKATTKAAAPVEKRKFQDTDEIPCVSITPGQYLLEGVRSKELYIFADMDDTRDIRYDDLMYLVRRRHPSVFKPRIIIQDKDFLAQNKDIDAVYSSLYSSADLKEILKMNANQLRSRVIALPDGAKEALKVIAKNMIDRGTFDSVTRIKILDEVLGTDLLFSLTNK